MLIVKDYSFHDLEDACWDCEDVLDAVYNNDKEDELMYFLEYEYFQDAPTLTEVNDLLRFEGDWVLETLGISTEDEEEEEEEGEEEEELDD